MQTIKQSILTIIICLAVVAGVSMVSAWTGAPPSGPPNDNTPTPINVSATQQIKSGPLQVNGFRNLGNSMFDGNVGIGTIDPKSLLHIKSDSPSVNAMINLESDLGIVNQIYTGRSAGGISGHLVLEPAIGKNTIINNGNVGIGTPGPGAKLTIGTPANAIGAMSTTLASYAGDLGSTAGNTINVASFGFGPGNTVALGIRGYRTAAGSNYTTTAVGLGMDVDNTLFSADKGLWFNTTGKVGIGTASPQEKLEVQGNLMVSYYTEPDKYNLIIQPHCVGDCNAKIGYSFITKSYSGGENYPLSFDNAGKVGIGTTGPGEKLEVNGNIKATAFLYSSDYNLKQNIQPLSGKTEMEKILKLSGVSFDWKESGKHDIGLIAQEVEKVFPEFVKTDENSELKSIDYAKLIVPLIESVKEQQKEIDELKAICK